MGLLKRIKKAADIALEVGTGEFQLGINQNVPPVDPGPDAWPLEDIARLAAQPDSRARAIVQDTEGAHERERGSHALVDRTSISLTLRLRNADGGFGPRCQHTVMVPRDATLLLTPGTEIPVLVDPSTGEIDRIDKKPMVEELRPRFAEARAAEKTRNRRGLGFVADALKEGASTLRSGEEPSADEAIEGVTADQWLLGRTALRRPMPDAVRDRTLERYGVPPGRWDSIDAAWSARAAADPDLAARLARIG